MQNHYTDDELIARLYGLEREGNHLAECPACRARWALIQTRRQAVLSSEPPMDASVLAAQRRRILARAEGGGWMLGAWSPAAAVAAVLLMGIALSRPAPAPSPAVASASAAPSDAQLMAEIYNLTQTAEPLAAAPLRGLFEDE